MVFYAFLKYQPSEQISRYLLAAPDAETIDEWWRAVSAPSKKSLGYQRLAPDFYSYTDFNNGHPSLATPEFINNKIILTLLNDRDGRILSLFPDQNRTDIRSGQTYFVRSKSNPDVFWWAGTRLNSPILASTTRRSRFRFDVEGAENGIVIIGTDRVVIYHVPGHNTVGVQDGKLCIQNNHEQFAFSDLKKLWLTSDTTESVSEDGNHLALPILEVDNGSGEEWELVK
ncbi:hypothetical protein F4802DRAFT_589744 [Xylaria palmicola]|nr:hypothetical protein F4802DRAFT_589744 [Xylaria palmicola]